MICKYFLATFEGFSLCWLWLLMHRSFKFCCILIYLFFLAACAFSVIIKKLQPNPMPESFTMFSSKNFILLTLIAVFGLSGITFCMICKDPTSSFLHVIIQSSQNHLLKRLSFPHQKVLAPLFKIMWLYTWEFISGLPITIHWS